MFMPRASAALVVVATLAVVSSFTALTAAQVLHNGCEADPKGLSLTQLGVQFDPGKVDHMGQSIAIGDFNDDGFKDIVLGGYTRSSEVPPAVTPAVLFLGTGNSPPFSETNPAVRYRLTIYGGDFDLFGFSAAFIGDISGDGIDDLAVGAPRFDGGPGLADSGRVSIIFGDDGLHPTDDPTTVFAAEVQNLTFDGAVAGGWFGASLATAHNASGALLKDLLIGAPGGEQVDTTSIKGSVYQIELPTMEAAGVLATSVPGVGIGASPLSGGTPGISGSLATGYVLTAHRVLSGKDTGDRFGAAVAFVGDLDGAAGQEFLVGAPQWQSEIDGFVTKGHGYARLFRMGSATPLVHIDGIQGADGTPPRGGEAFGFAVAGGFDFNLDSVPDLLIGSPLFTVDADGMGGGKVHAGRARAFSVDLADPGNPVVTSLLDDGAPNHTVMVGKGGSDQFGCSVAGMPSIDGDFVPDIIVGAWKATIDPLSFCVTGHARTSEGGSATVFSPGSLPTAGAEILDFYGETYRDHTGRAVAAENLFGSSSRPEIILTGLAWTPPGSVVGVDPTEVGKGYVWDGDTVF